MWQILGLPICVQLRKAPSLIGLADLCKAFDCLDHGLLTGKLYAHCFSLPTLRLILDYL